MLQVLFKYTGCSKKMYEFNNFLIFAKRILIEDFFKLIIKLCILQRKKFLQTLKLPQKSLIEALYIQKK